MNFDVQRLYELLPAVYRLRDTEKGRPGAAPGSAGLTEEHRQRIERQTAGPLKALLWVIAEQVAVIEEDLAQLYDDQFIETCAEWVVPYIADLVGHPLREHADDRVSLRAEVANTIAYRRRKGTVAVLEQVARDTTGWRARAVEFFRLLGCTQQMNHVRPNGVYSPDLRNWEPLERADTAFDTLGHTVDVRGKYSVSNIGIFLWRLRAYSQTESLACPAAKPPHQDQLFHFHPLGQDTQLFTNPETENAMEHLAEPIHVPMPISRVVLGRKLEQYYAKGRSLHIEVNEHGTEDQYRDLSAERIEVRDLSDWEYRPKHGQVAIDPVLGRIAFGVAQKAPPRVTFHYGFSADIGGGEYERASTFETRTRPVGRPVVEVPGQYDTLQDALDATKEGGCVKICRNQRFPESLTIAVAKSARIELRAVNGCRPAIAREKSADSSIALRIEGNEDSEVTLNGLLIRGSLIVKNTRMRRLRLRHCTLVPAPAPSLIIDDPNITVEIEHCIVGGLEIITAAQVHIADSIVDATHPGRWALSGKDETLANTTLRILRSTVLGRVQVRTLELAENVIFQGRLSVGQQQAGCMRFCYAPFNSHTPRRFRCVPELTQTAASGEQDDVAEDSRGGHRPQFECTRYGQPSYCQLSRHCPDAIRRGADDNSEMGAFHHLFQPQRGDALKARLQRYAPLGMTTSIYHVT
jgi:hypothetical protein